ncbi:type II toxin-antitoxin system RelE/ParE family toxin [Pseudodesulfovibrio portus]|uniref:type II toxin-antitoxin system RelE/ParE family toxin n=1 Tax=Pseudodesulfovibrio portus TaxID=231439 RepID=UPI002230D5CD|nr:type II toxin-antitoxin system RelE/ParE family toxin [Pseudodesulfovibrio portus]
MIKSFNNKTTEALFNREVPKGFPEDLAKRAYRKLLIIDAAFKLNDLRVPPGNRLEALSGNRRGQHSIRINDQFRICFKWKNNHAYQVEITDYH